jgi:hypothetical protein
MWKMREDMGLLREAGERRRGREGPGDERVQEKEKRAREDKKDIFEWLKLSTK